MPRQYFIYLLIYLFIYQSFCAAHLFIYWSLCAACLFIDWSLCVACYLFIYLLVTLCGTQDLSSPTTDQIHAPAVEAWSLLPGNSPR